MTNSTAQRRTAFNAAKGLIFAASILPLGIASAPALANGIQMLPPVTEATKLYGDKDHPGLTPTPCPAGSSSIITWDGTNPMSCATGAMISAGNVGIGTINPGYTSSWHPVPAMHILDIAGNGTNDSFSEGVLQLSSNAPALGSGYQTGALIFSADNNGGANLGAGITAALGALGTQGYGTDLTFWTNSGNHAPEAPYGGSHEPRMVIDHNGNVGIGTSSPNYLLHVQGTAYAMGGAGALSDRRHKMDIQPFAADALDIVAKLKPVTFLWKAPKDDGMKGSQIGFIAQDVEPVLPEVVITEHNAEKTLGLRYDSLIPVLAKAIQEQQAAFQEEHAAFQEESAKVERLEAANDDLQRAVQRLQAGNHDDK